VLIVPSERTPAAIQQQQQQQQQQHLVKNTP
jgi:hypothetical protein